MQFKVTVYKGYFCQEDIPKEDIITQCVREATDIDSVKWLDLVTASDSLTVRGSISNDGARYYDFGSWSRFIKIEKA